MGRAVRHPHLNVSAEADFTAHFKSPNRFPLGLNKLRDVLPPFATITLLGYLAVRAQSMLFFAFATPAYC